MPVHQSQKWGGINRCHDCFVYRTDSASREGSPTHRETPTKLKRARLADDLNEKIALRPGPLELVEKNIIPADSTVKEAVMRGISGRMRRVGMLFNCVRNTL